MLSRLQSLPTRQDREKERAVRRQACRQKGGMIADMLENIRRIGIFMIAAQTVIHFAAGKQYEKYMKLIASVVILLLFVSPFVDSSEDIVAKWRSEAEKMAEQMGQYDTWQAEIPYVQGRVGEEALQQLEEEIKTRLNGIVDDAADQVVDVEIDLGGQAEENQAFRCIRVIMQKRAKEVPDHPETVREREIRIGKITAGGQKEAGEAQEETKQDAQNMRLLEYQSLFAQTLGITKDRVEVMYRGGW